MKTRHAIALFILGLCLNFVGALIKILHYPGADEILITATILQVLGVLLFVYKLWTNPKVKEFLDW
jgi:hypothetical protein